MTVEEAKERWYGIKQEALDNLERRGKEILSLETEAVEVLSKLYTKYAEAGLSEVESLIEMLKILERITKEDK